MGKPAPVNLAASVHQRLVTLARRDRLDPNLILNRFVLERFVFRLSQHPHRDRFVLKGAMLFAVWTKYPYRPTRDLDLLGYGDMSDDGVRRVMADICGCEAPPDGVEFDSDSIEISEIRDGDEYHGKRVVLAARLGNGQYRLQVDIGIGDAITTSAPTVEFPTLLDFPAPRLRAYTRETVVAEKYQAMLELGMRNSRMKDFYDIWVLARDFAFEGRTLATAVGATFSRRATPIPKTPPLALTSEFSEHPDKAVQWRAFLRRSGLDAGTTLRDVVDVLAAFLWPVTQALAQEQDFGGREWPPGGPWRQQAAESTAADR
jgi:hypothetical protein